MEAEFFYKKTSYFQKYEKKNLVKDDVPEKLKDNCIKGF